MAKDQTKPSAEGEERAPLTDAQKAAYQATLDAGPKDEKKFTDAERDARKAAKQALLEDENPKTRFARLSYARLNAALDVIVLLGNLSGPNYEYSEAQVDFIRAQLHKGVDRAMDRFKPKDKPSRERVEIPEG